MPNTPGPETKSQADEHGRTMRHYLTLGICNACAGQAAWGHQNGFSSVHPPCLSCLPIVASFPTEQPAPWRSLSRRYGRRPPAGANGRPQPSI